MNFVCADDTHGAPIMLRAEAEGITPEELVAREPYRAFVDVARALGRSLAAAGIPIVSGMAMGIDCAAHEGVLSVGGLTVAVLAGEPERAYPASAASLHRRIVESTGGVCSILFEHSPRTGVLHPTSAFGLESLSTDPLIAAVMRADGVDADELRPALNEMAELVSSRSEEAGLSSGAITASRVEA